MSQQPKEKYAKLIQQLLEHKVISSPQLDIAVADAELTGMSLDEVLLARRWVTEETLYKVAPWLKQVSIAPGNHFPASGQSDQAAAGAAAGDQLHSNGGDDYDENLRKYRELMDKILGQANI